MILAFALMSGMAAAPGPVMGHSGTLMYGSGPANTSKVQVAIPRDSSVEINSYSANVRANENTTTLKGPAVVVNTSSRSDSIPARTAAPVPALKPTAGSVQVPSGSGQSGPAIVRSASAASASAPAGQQVESANLALVPARHVWEAPAAATPTRGFDALN